MPLDKAIKLTSQLPTNLNEPPYKGLIWDSSNKCIIIANNVTLREVLLYLLGRRSKPSDITLLERYRKIMNDPYIELPQRII